MSSYSELIKNFEKIRNYMCEFYVYGFKSRDEYNKKSARSYDDERRRMESWLGDHMSFVRTPEGKNVFISIDSRVSQHNPFYKALKAKSFTDGDITLHFILFDILHSPEVVLSLPQILEQIDGYLSAFENPMVFDESTIRKKLKEYISQGIIVAEKYGRKMLYRRAEDVVLPDITDTLNFYSEIAPCGVIGSFLLDKQTEQDDNFSFKHHYITSALDGTMPLTTIQKQWLKAISLDPRIKLFDIEFQGFEEVEPLFTSEDYYIYDKYVDGDPFDDEEYIKRFRTILSAINEKQPLKIQMVNRKGNTVSMTVMPQRLEYSEKDDKFRLISTGCRYGGIVNLARITTCEKCNATRHATHHVSMESKESLALRIFDERNALERTLLHFAHFEKRVERIDKKRYLVHIKYNKSDETEMVIRILSFGPMVEVVEPDEFKKLIIARLKSQKSCELK